MIQIPVLQGSKPKVSLVQQCSTEVKCNCASEPILAQLFISSIPLDQDDNIKRVHFPSRSTTSLRNCNVGRYVCQGPSVEPHACMKIRIESHVVALFTLFFTPRASSQHEHKAVNASAIITKSSFKGDRCSFNPLQAGSWLQVSQAWDVSDY